MNRNLLLSIDLGTTACKAAVFEPGGRVLGEGYVEYPLVARSEVEIEQDAGEWWDVTVRAVNLAFESAQVGRAGLCAGSHVETGIWAGAGVSPDEVVALSVSSQGISVVPVDRHGEPLRMAISWLDTRARDQGEWLERELGGSEKIFHATGKRPSAAYTLPKLLWFRDNEPDVFRAADKFLMPLDFIVKRLTGQAVTDHSMASGTLMYDLHEGGWSGSVLDKCGISRAVLPEIRWAGSAISKLMPKAARELGLSPETLVVLGGQDQKCAALGAGLAPGTATISLGTAGALTAYARRPVLDAGMRIPCCPHVEGKRWVLEGVVSTAGASVKWFASAVMEAFAASGNVSSIDDLSKGCGVSNIGNIGNMGNVSSTGDRDSFGKAGNIGDTIAAAGEDSSRTLSRLYQHLDELASKSRAGSGGLFFLPHLAGASTPHWNAGAKGLFHGISLATTAGDLFRSVLEGIAFEFKENLEIIESLVGPVNEVIIFGGGARSPVWAGIFANALNKPVLRLSTSEAASLGASILAGVGSGIYKTYAEGLTAVEGLRSRENPDPGLVAAYEDVFRDYVETESAFLGLNGHS
ncbi:MAG: hypothetical protein HPY71_12370 [Firmicutes bacterium]|nr:hypothetical protein [Bacillota bacterium]